MSRPGSASDCPDLTRSNSNSPPEYIPVPNVNPRFSRILQFVRIFAARREWYRGDRPPPKPYTPTLAITNDISMTEFVLQSNYEISDSEFMAGIFLDETVEEDITAYSKLLVDIQRLALEIYQQTRSCPLTQIKPVLIKRSCDNIAGKYPSVFDLDFDPSIEGQISRDTSDKKLGVFRRHSVGATEGANGQMQQEKPISPLHIKFHLSWPIVYLLKREYEQIQILSKKRQLSEDKNNNSTSKKSLK